MKMNKFMALALCLVMGSAVASADVIVKEDFQGATRLSWSEYILGKTSATVKDGFLEIKSKPSLVAALLGGQTYARVSTVLPIEINTDFVIRTTLCPEKIDYTSLFGIEFDRDKWFNSYSFLICQDWCAVQVAGKTVTSIPVKVEGGKKQEIQLVVTKTGGICKIEINGMTATSFRMDDLYYPHFAFVVNGDNTVKVTEFIVEQ